MLQLVSAGLMAIISYEVDGLYVLLIFTLLIHFWLYF